MTFGDTIRARLKKILKDRGFSSYRSFERDIGHSNNWLHRKMNGKRGLSLNDIDKMLDHIDADPDALLGVTNTSEDT